jgi:hypothetical protein
MFKSEDKSRSTFGLDPRYRPRLFGARLVRAWIARGGGGRTGPRNGAASLSSGPSLPGRYFAALRDLLPVDRHEPVTQRLHETYERVLL